MQVSSAAMITSRGFLAPQHLASLVTMTTLKGSLESQNGTSSWCGWRDGLQIWTVAKNTLNKEWWTANKGCGPLARGSGVPRGGFGVFKTPPRNSEDIGGVLDRMSKNRHLDFLL